MQRNPGTDLEKTFASFIGKQICADLMEALDSYHFTHIDSSSRPQRRSRTINARFLNVTRALFKYLGEGIVTQDGIKTFLQDQESAVCDLHDPENKNVEVSLLFPRKYRECKLADVAEP